MIPKCRVCLRPLGPKGCPECKDLVCKFCGNVNKHVIGGFACVDCSRRFLRLAAEASGLLPERDAIGERLQSIVELRLEGAETPFFSEACLYELVGKEDARTILAVLNALFETLGFSLYYPFYDKKDSQQVQDV